MIGLSGRPGAARVLLSGALIAGVIPVIASAQAAPVGVVAENVEHVAVVPGGTGGHSVIQGDRLYVGAYGYGMRLFDISDPRDPELLGQFVPGPQPGAPDLDPGVRADAVPDAAVMRDAAGNERHIVTLNGTGRTAGAQQTEFLDWTDPANPRLLFRFTNRDDGESHNGDIVDARGWWVPSGLREFRIYDLNPLLSADGPKAPATLFRGNPAELWAKSPHFDGKPGGGTTSIHDIEIYADREVVRNGVVEKRDIALVAEGGNYLQGNNSGSLYIIDITEPTAPVVLLRHQRAAADGKPQRYVHEAQFLEGQPDILITTDEDLHNGCDNGGIAVFRVSDDLTSIDELSQWFIGLRTPAALCSVHVMSTKDDYAFFGSYNAGLQVVDLSDPANPKRAGQYIGAGANSWGALVHPTHEGYLTYVGDFGGRGLDVLDFQPPGPPAAQPSPQPSAGGPDEDECEDRPKGGEPGNGKPSDRPGNGKPSERPGNGKPSERPGDGDCEGRPGDRKPR